MALSHSRAIGIQVLKLKHSSGRKSYHARQRQIVPRFAHGKKARLP